MTLTTTPLAAAPSSMGCLEWEDNWTVGGVALRGELMDAEGNVWLAQQPMTLETYDALEVPAGLHRSGVGKSVADWAYFRRSPRTLDDGPLETIEVSGVRFARAALAGHPEPAVRSAMVLPIYKHHVVGYAAGRTLDILDMGDGWDHIPQGSQVRFAGQGWDKPLPPLALPEGWSMRHITLTSDLVVEVHCPARVSVLPSGDLFMGPVRLSL